MDLQEKFHLLNQQKDTIKQVNKKYLRNTLNKKVVDKVEQDTNDDKIMHYTIKEVQDWNERKTIRKGNKLTNSTYSNYNKLAELSYYKNLKDIAKVDGEDSKEVLSSVIKQQNVRRMGKRRDGVSGAGINDKNRQFNLKVEREGKTK